MTEKEFSQKVLMNIKNEINENAGILNPPLKL